MNLARYEFSPLSLRAGMKNTAELGKKKEEISKRKIRERAKRLLGEAAEGYGMEIVELER